MSPIDFNALDTTIHGPLRLGILTALHMDGPLGFTALRKRLETTDGAMGAHLQTLESQGYIASRKAFVRRRPQTTYRLTPQGRKALARYLDAMSKLLDALEVRRRAGEG